MEREEVEDRGKMCGRIIQASGPLSLAIVDGLDVRDSRLTNAPRRYNAAPSQELLVIRQNHQTERSLDFLRWGLIPYWCNDPKGGRKPIRGDKGIGRDERSDAQSPALAEAFARSGIPCKKHSHEALAQERGVRAILRELDAAATSGPEGRSSLVDALNAAAARESEIGPYGWRYSSCSCFSCGLLRRGASADASRARSRCRRGTPRRAGPAAGRAKPLERAG
jgi:hypothetical protein